MKIPSRKGKYLMSRRNTKPHQLIKHAKISYSIVSLVFCKFWYRTYRNCLNQVPQSWGTLIISKSAKSVSSIPFVGNPHFSILLHSMWYLKKLIYVSKITGHHFPVWVLNSKLRMRIHNSITAILFCLQNTWFSENKNLTLNNLKMYMLNV